MCTNGAMFLCHSYWATCLIVIFRCKSLAHAKIRKDKGQSCHACLFHYGNISFQFHAIIYSSNLDQSSIFVILLIAAWRLDALSSVLSYWLFSAFLCYWCWVDKKRRNKIGNFHVAQYFTFVSFLDLQNSIKGQFHHAEVILSFYIGLNEWHEFYGSLFAVSFS